MKLLTSRDWKPSGSSPAARNRARVRYRRPNCFRKQNRDTAPVLRVKRQYVVWETVGCAMGAYEAAPASAGVCGSRRSRMRENSLISRHLWPRRVCALRMRETVALACEMPGGNGIVLDYDVARFFADSEALYSDEGTRDMNHLIFGKAVSGFSAFVRHRPAIRLREHLSRCFAPFDGGRHGFRRPRSRGGATSPAATRRNSDRDQA